MKLAEATSEVQCGPMKVGKWTKFKKKTRLGMGTHTFNPSTWEIEAQQTLPKKQNLCNITLSNEFAEKLRNLDGEA